MNELAQLHALPTEIAIRMEAWSVEARSALSQSTLRAYKADAAAYALWCEESGLNALPAAPESIAVFLRREAETKSVATVRRRAATISRLHKAAGVENPCEHELVKLALKGIAKTKGTDQRQAAPLSGRDAVTICARSGDRLIDARNLALLLVGRDLLARSSELVAIETGDIEWDEDGALIRVRRRKTSTETRTYYIGPEASQALKAWLERAEITEGPVFRSVSPGGNVKPSKSIDRAPCSGHHDIEDGIVSRREMVVGNNDAGYFVGRRGKSLCAMPELMRMKPAVREGPPWSGRIEPNEYDVADVEDRIQVGRNDFAVERVWLEEALENPPERHVVVARDHEQRDVG